MPPTDDPVLRAMRDKFGPEIIAEIAAEVERKRALGWTKADFAEALRKLLEGEGMQDNTEGVRREKQAELNSNATERAALEAKYGKVWDTKELTAEFEVRSFLAPLVFVRCRATGVTGSLMFQHAPRYYFQFTQDPS